MSTPKFVAATIAPWLIILAALWYTVTEITNYNAEIEAVAAQMRENRLAMQEVRKKYERMVEESNSAAERLKAAAREVEKQQ